MKQSAQNIEKLQIASEATNYKKETKKIFSVADLWRIHNQKRGFAVRRY